MGYAHISYGALVVASLAIGCGEQAVAPDVPQVEEAEAVRPIDEGLQPAVADTQPVEGEAISEIDAEAVGALMRLLEPYGDRDGRAGFVGAEAYPAAWLAPDEEPRDP